MALSPRNGSPDFEACGSSDYEVRLAQTQAEVVEAQKLRYRVFYEEMDAKPTEEIARCRREIDPFDEICDHLLIFDKGERKVIATCRLLQRAAKPPQRHFYSEGEFNLSPIMDISLGSNCLELSRACVAANYRSKQIPDILWRSIARYSQHYDIETLFGCASLPGIDPEALSMPLSWMYHHHLAPPQHRVRALPHLCVSMDRIPKDKLNIRESMRFMPPLLKAYLRCGCWIGEGAAVDKTFNTTDVFVSLHIGHELKERYYDRYYNKKAVNEANSLAP